VTARRQNSPASIFATLQKCVAMLPAAMRWKWAALIPISLLTGIVEAGAAAAVFALIKIIGDPAQIVRIPVAAKIASALPGSTARTQLLIFTGLIAVYYVVKNLLVIGSQYLRHKIAGESTAALKSTMFKGYLAAAYPFHLGRNSADLISNTNFCVDMVCKEAMEAAVAAGSELLTAVAITVVLLVTAPEVTLIAGTFLLVLLAALLRLTRRMANYFGTQRHQLERDSLQALQEALGAIKEVKALGREDFFYRSFGEKQRRVLELGYLGKTLETITPQVTETIFVCGALAVVALVTGIGQASAQGPPLLALFAYAAFRIVPAANRVGWRVNQVRGAAAAVESLYDDYLLVAGTDWEDVAAERQSAHFRESIALERVSYTFAGADTPALQDVSLTIRFGESIGIVGPTGAGKTTLVDLVIGLLRPSSGRILIDGNDVSGRLSAWKRNIGYVPQSIFLIDDSLRRNIALGIGDSEIDEGRVRAAVRMAQLERFVAELPQGLDTSVGERGIRLSGGERQRVGIARALYHDPDLLVFDEATSALDVATEDAVSAAIEALHGKKTLLVVAHRLSSVRRCERLVFVSEGRVGAYGSYDDLLRDHPEFQRMVRAQDRINPASA
jgi:ABC-type multidrug transport system fused ATPase/permease subunit